MSNQRLGPGAPLPTINQGSPQHKTVQHLLPTEAEVDWGDPMPLHKPSTTTQIAFTNLGGIPLHRSSLQNNKIHTFLDNNHIDIFLNAENNTAWHLVPTEDQ